MEGLVLARFASSLNVMTPPALRPLPSHNRSRYRLHWNFEIDRGPIEMDVVTLNVRTWQEARLLADRLQGWLFRGQSDANWSLSTSIERVGEIGQQRPRF